MNWKFYYKKYLSFKAGLKITDSDNGFLTSRGWSKLHRYESVMIKNGWMPHETIDWDD
jgi:hypothetical protein